MERRRVHRQRVCLEGLVTSGPESPLAPVRIRNRSAAGAEFVLPEGRLFSSEVELSIPQGNELWTARVVWRRLDRFGVEFVDRARQAVQRPAPPQGVRAMQDTLDRRYRAVTARPSA